LADLVGRDACVAGPPAMMRALLDVMLGQGLWLEHACGRNAAATIGIWGHHDRCCRATLPGGEMAHPLGKGYVCTKCGAQVIATKGGSGTLKYRGVPMELKRPEETEPPPR
jgi:hypothetical protein